MGSNTGLEAADSSLSRQSGEVSYCVPLSEEKDWEFHFHEVTILGSVVYAYTWLVPLLLWALLWWRGSRDRYTLLELLSVYGYCIAIFIPITVSVHCSETCISIS